MLPESLAPAAVGLAEALFDRGAGIPADRIEWTLHEVDELSIASGFKTRALFLVTLFLVEHLSFLFGELAKLSDLDLRSRVRYLARLDASPLAALVALPKALLCLVYFEHPEALRETGYDGKPMIEHAQAEAPSAPSPRSRSTSRNLRTIA
ncbi:MAG: hypothetical protein HY791_16365 [Deltaproteobacteria bacterium]|nr:hypothetical protein [Deltaproteobacteria bacterium]